MTEEIIRWDYLEAIAEEKRAEWDQPSSTRFVVIDGMMADGICRELADFSKIAAKTEKPLKKNHKHVRGKSGSNNPDNMTELQRRFFEEVNSPRFIALVEKITGISPIYADDTLNGGGLHQIRTGGFLNVHTDFNFEPKTRRNRRLNLLLYLNENWNPEWAGNIELWTEQLDRPFFSATPDANRVLIFETDELSYHGHPVPLATPPEITRKSLAVYYYSEWPDGLEYRKETGYQLTRLQWAQLMSRIAKSMARKPMSEKEIIKALELHYMTRDIKQAYDTLMGLRSARVIREDYWEYPDGTLSLSGPPEK